MKRCDNIRNSSLGQCRRPAALGTPRVGVPFQVKPFLDASTALHSTHFALPKALTPCVEAVPRPCRAALRRPAIRHGVPAAEWHCQKGRGKVCL